MCFLLVLSNLMDCFLFSLSFLLFSSLTFLLLTLTNMASSSSLAPPSLTPVMKDGECRNWAELPSDLTSWILSKLSAVDILQNAQKVCTKWHRVCKDPAMWRKIDMRNSGDLRYNLVMMCHHAVDS
ncbi:unnamed protein product [Brassica oleracea var. botrytis]